MDYEYQASGGISISTQETQKEIVIRIVSQEEKPVFITITHTSHYSVLSNGSIATGGFFDEGNIFITQKDRAA
jgi:hypothetical protein